MVGIYWYAIEKVSGETRQRLHEQLFQYRLVTLCPFLVDDACAIHPLRPMACRPFNVFDGVCAEGEMPTTPGGTTC